MLLVRANKMMVGSEVAGSWAGGLVGFVSFPCGFHVSHVQRLVVYLFLFLHWPRLCVYTKACHRTEKFQDCS